MVKLPKRFSVGERIFAKVRGYPAWPAKIENITDPNTKNAKYHVVFFGTKEIGTCKVEDIYPYEENKEKFSKTVRRKFFQEGLQELEKDLIQNPNPATMDDSVSAMDVSESAADETTDRDTSSVEPTSGENEEENQHGNLVIDEGDKKKTAKRKSQIPPSTPEVSDPKKKRGRKSLGAVLTESTPKQDVTINDSIDEDSEKKTVSRSGRKIKPKRFHDSIDAEISIDSSRNDTPVRNRTKSKTEEIVENTDTPITPLKKRMSVENDRRSHAKEESDIDSQLKLKILRTESQILFLDTQIRSSLSLERANTDECLEAMDQLGELQITRLMLKKHSSIVETIKRLRRYVGNLKDWKLSEEETIIFKQKSELIQKKAATIYIKFKSLFGITENESFWENYLEQCQQLKDQTKDLTQEEFYSLTSDPTEPYKSLDDSSTDGSPVKGDSSVDAVSNKMSATTIESK